MNMKEPKIRFKGFNGEWEESTLLDVVTLYNGLTYTPNDVSDHGTLVLRSSNVQEGEISLLDNVFVKSEVATSPNVQKGDIIVVVRNGSRALIGKHAQIKTDMPNTVIGAFMAGMHTDEPEFINALLCTSSFDNEVTINLGATINQITNGTFRSMKFLFPEKEEQKTLGSYFQHIDSLIQSTTKKIESLKQVKVASLQSMFPQEGETKPRVRFNGFEGEWEKVAIKDIATINPKTNIPNIFEYVDLESVVGTELKSHRTETKQTAPSRAQRLAHNGDIFYQTVRPYQKNNLYFNLDEDNFVFSSGYAQIRANLCGSFLFAVMQQDSFVQKVMDNCTGTSFPAINANVLGTLKIMVTKNIVEQTAIASYFTNLDKQITLQTQRLEKLKQVKSACLDNMFV